MIATIQFDVVRPAAVVVVSPLPWILELHVAFLGLISVRLFFCFHDLVLNFLCTRGLALILWHFLATGRRRRRKWKSLAILRKLED